MQIHLRGSARPVRRIGTVVLFSFLAGPPLASQAPRQPELTVPAQIQALLQANPTPYHFAAGVPCFYQRRGFAPAWSGEAGLDSESTGELLSVIQESTYHGLRPGDYRLDDLRRRLEAAQSRQSPNELAELDLLLTDAFLNL